MSFKKKYLGILLLVLCMMGIMTACGGKEAKDDGNVTEAARETVTQAPESSQSMTDTDQSSTVIEPVTEATDVTEEEVETKEKEDISDTDQSQDSMVGRIVMPDTPVLNLRQQADAGSQIQVRLSPQDLIRVLEVKGDWYKARVYHAEKYYDGFVSKDYVKTVTRGKVLGDAVLYKNAKGNGAKVTDLSSEAVVHIYDMKQSTYQVVADDQGEEYFGFIDKSMVEPEGELDLGKEIYLTFDDGPGEYTEKLLGILDKYNVKVTFFVTNQYSDYINMIKKEADAGHAVVVHTYSHDYAKIYKSVDAYFADYDKMADIIEKQTGSRPTIFRFPGGSSNTISAKYSKGIMTKLSKEAEARGLVYSDWNVTSGDAGETTSTQKVFENVTKEIKMNGRMASVVLQHDIKGFSVDAVEDIIKWGLDNGYTFKAMTETEGIVHHGINN